MANTIWNTADKTANVTLTGSSLIATSTSTANASARSVDRIISGKFYWEVTVNPLPTAGSSSGVGIALGTVNISTSTYVLGGLGVGLAGVNTNGTLFVNGVSSGVTLGAFTAGVVVCFAVDLSASLIWVRYGAAGNWNAAAGNNPAIGVGGVSMPGFGGGIPIHAHGIMGGVSGAAFTGNFGDTAFTGAVPSGYTSGFTAASAATWSPTDKSGNVALTGSNLVATLSSGGQAYVRSDNTQSTGKFYWECQPTVWTSSLTSVGFCPSSLVTPSGATAAKLCAVYNTGQIWLDTTNTGATLGTRANGDIIGIALDLTGLLAWFRVAPSGNWNGSGTANPATGTGGISVAIAGGITPTKVLATASSAAESFTANFSGAFSGAVPSGFTSGWPASPAIPTNALATQAVAEHWFTTNPAAQVTQVLVEHWMSVADAPPVVPGVDTRVMVLA